jgi:Fe-S-cluster containining protein
MYEGFNMSEETNPALENIKTVAFKCTRCGTCCKALIMRTELATMGLYLQVDETHLFPARFIKPMYGVGIKGKARPRPAKTIAYQFTAQLCPHYEEGKGCKIYGERPSICRSFPIEATMASRTCPVIASAVREDEVFNLDNASVANERQANLAHMKYLMGFREKGLGRGFWVYDLATGKWKRVEKK